ncbi:type I secretion system permease/ATPase [Zavarzinia compransoris]|uniref:type I secretion system permease/ATPase n=1 Tax=Zavarzinia marina TaxID=2911065 RepID=UPI001F24919D|nr:type I secretion system permease/ATPase [Zavarzinia marina]MCF4164692.1 type I secretion system permease/ATPase [Zavarzinia marina]
MTETTEARDKPWREHWFWGAFWRSRWIYAQVVLAAAVTNVFALSTSLFSMTVYDRVIPNNAMESLAALAIGMCIVVAFDMVIKLIRAYFIDIASRRADLDIGERVFDQVLRMPLAARRGASGAFASTMREFETLRDFFTSATLVAIVDLPFILLFLFVIWMVGGWLVLVPALALPLVLLAALASQPALSRLSRLGLKSARTKQAVLVETLAGMETVKAVGAGDAMAARWRDGVAHGAEIGQQSRFWSQLAVNAAGFAQQAVQVGVVTYGVFLIRDGELSMGALIACSILSGRALAPLAQLANVLARAHHAAAAYKTLTEIMGAPTEAAPTGLAKTSFDGAIEFRNVIFRYPGKPYRALDDVSFRIEPGERVALLGRVGSGKSTVARLVLGLHAPEDGTVTIDGTEVRQLDPDLMRKAMGVALQDVCLFSGTIRDNVCIGVEGVGDDRLLAAAEASGLHDMIGGMPQGYDLEIEERGEGLSGGQRQAIALTRALVREPAVFVMDEPTSAMDVRTEAQFIERMKTIVEGRTMLLVTHRTAMLELVDKVIVLDRGKVVAAGPRDRVLAALANQTPRPAREAVA